MHGGLVHMVTHMHNHPRHKGYMYRHHNQVHVVECMDIKPHHLGAMVRDNHKQAHMVGNPHHKGFTTRRHHHRGHTPSHPRPGAAMGSHRDQLVPMATHHRHTNREDPDTGRRILEPIGRHTTTMVLTNGDPKTNSSGEDRRYMAGTTANMMAIECAIRGTRTNGC